MLYYDNFDALLIQSCGVIAMEGTHFAMITLQGELLIYAIYAKKMLSGRLVMFL